MSLYVDRPKGLWVCTWFLMFGLVWSAYVLFSLVKFGLVWSIHIQTNKLNNFLILINLICEFLCWKSVTDERMDGRTNKQTDLCIELRYAQLIMHCWIGKYSIRIALWENNFKPTKRVLQTAGTMVSVPRSKKSLTIVSYNIY